MEYKLSGKNKENFFFRFHFLSLILNNLHYHICLLDQQHQFQV